MFSCCPVRNGRMGVGNNRSNIGRFFDVPFTQLDELSDVMKIIY